MDDEQVLAELVKIRSAVQWVAFLLTVSIVVGALLLFAGSA